MKKCAVMLFALLFAAACSKTEPSQPQPEQSAPAAAEAAQAGPSAAQRARAEVTFDNETYVLLNAQSTATEVINEYLRPAETFADYTRMIALQVFHVQVPLEQYLETFEQNLNNLSQSVTNLFTFGDEAKGTRGISFFIEGNGALEYNIFNFRKMENGDIEGLHFIARIPAGKYVAGSPETEQFFAHYNQRAVWQKLIEETPFPPLYAEVPPQEESSVAPNVPGEAGVQRSEPNPAAGQAPTEPVAGQPVAAPAAHTGTSPDLRVARALSLLKNISASQRRYYAQHQAYASDFSGLDVRVGTANGTVTEDADFSYRLFPASMTLTSKDAAAPFTFALFFTAPAQGQTEEFVACYDTSFPQAVSQAEAQGMEHCKKK